jgi:hypothetical protein
MRYKRGRLVRMVELKNLQINPSASLGNKFNKSTIFLFRRLRQIFFIQT